MDDKVWHLSQASIEWIPQKASVMSLKLAKVDRKGCPSSIAPELGV